MKWLILGAALVGAQMYGESFQVEGAIAPKEIQALTSCQATLEAHFPDRYTPQLFGVPSFLEQPVGDWKAMDVLSKPASGAVRITLTLQPQRTGTLFYTPGVLFFQNSAAPEQPVVWLLPALSADCVPSGLSGIEPAPPLPLHYEAHVSMSDANRARMMDPELLAWEKDALITTFLRREHVWTALKSCFLLLTVTVLILWLASRFSQYLGPRRLMARPRDLAAEWGMLTRSPEAEWSMLTAWVARAIGMIEQLPDVALTYPELEQLVSKSASFSADEKARLGTIFHRLETISYAGSAPTAGEWQAITSDLSSLVGEKLASRVRESRDRSQ